MFNIRNMIYFLTMLSFVLFMNVACSNNESEAKNDNKGEVALASADTPASSDIPVYTIEGVGKAEKGKAADFSWTENGTVKQFSKVTKGKVVFLNFWGTWCPPCRMEIPDIIEISKDLKDEDFIVIGISMENNPKGALRKVKNYVKANGIPYLNLISTPAFVSAYGGVQVVPTTIIIDKNGNIAERIRGMRNKTQFMKSIENAMKVSAQ